MSRRSTECHNRVPIRYVSNLSARDAQRQFRGYQWSKYERSIHNGNDIEESVHAVNYAEIGGVCAEFCGAR